MTSCRSISARRRTPAPCRARREHAIPVKPIDGFLPRFEALIARVLRDQRGRRGSRSSAPAPAASSSCSSVERRLRGEAAAAGCDPGGLAFTLVSGSDDDPADVSARIPAALRADFRRARHRGRHRRARAAASRRASCLRRPRADSSRRDSLDHAAPPPRRGSRTPGSTLDPDGFVRVDACLRAEGRDDVFAAGDIASFCPRALPKSGVYAVRAGPVLADNIRRPLTGGRCDPSGRKPTRSTSSRPATRTRSARATGLVFAGRWVWRLEGLDRPPLHAAGSTRFRQWPRPRARPGLAARRSGRLSRRSRRSPCAAADAAPRSARPCCRARSARIAPASAGRRGRRPRQRRTTPRVVDTGGQTLARAHGRLLPRHRRRPLPVRQDRRQPRARRHLRHGRRAPDGARHRHRSRMGWRPRSRRTSRP